MKKMRKEMADIGTANGEKEKGKNKEKYERKIKKENKQVITGKNKEWEKNKEDIPLSR